MKLTLAAAVCILLILAISKLESKSEPLANHPLRLDEFLAIIQGRAHDLELRNTVVKSLDQCPDPIEKGAMILALSAQRPFLADWLCDEYLRRGEFRFITWPLFLTDQDIHETDVTAVMRSDLINKSPFYSSLVLHQARRRDPTIAPKISRYFEQLKPCQERLMKNRKKSREKAKPIRHGVSFFAEKRP